MLIVDIQDSNFQKEKKNTVLQVAMVFVKKTFHNVFEVPFYRQYSRSNYCSNFKYQFKLHIADL